MPLDEERILFESEIMSRELPQFKLYLFYRCFQGWYKTLTRGCQYQLRLELSPYHPHERPSLYVTFPYTLRKYDGGTINSMGASHRFHTDKNRLNGYVQICHFSSWDASKTCVGVFCKGLLWLEAYDVHLLTGMDMADILEQWKRRQS